MGDLPPENESRYNAIETGQVRDSPRRCCEDPLPKVANLVANGIYVNYISLIKSNVGATGFEPATLCSQSKSLARELGQKIPENGGVSG